MTAIMIDGEHLTIADVIAVARHNAPVKLAPAARSEVARCRRVVERILQGSEIVYGINTGVGDLCRVIIPPDQLEQLQRNLIYSHAVGVGDPLPVDTTRAVVLLSANALSKGYSGVRVEIVDMLIELLNRGVTPMIPQKGSVGASGDLAPLAHLTLVLMGEGETWLDGTRMDGILALERLGLTPLTLQAKEGLALINGTHVMAGIGALLVHDAENLLKAAQIAGAMSLEALKGTDKPFREKIHLLRPHRGQVQVARNMRLLIQDSDLIRAPDDYSRVQDAYTLRCIPQVYGATKDALAYVRGVIETELNAATDNPLVFPEDEESISAGNFHGQPIALALDFLGIAMAELGDIAERTIDRLVNPHYSQLPAFLTGRSGINSGFMITQYTAAALVSENKVLAHPASVDSIPTSGGQEDHVSMGTISACKAEGIIRNVEHIIAIELLCAAQALDFHRPLQAGRATRAAHALIRSHIPELIEDRPLQRDLAQAVALVKSRELLKAVEDEIGPMA